MQTRERFNRWRILVLLLVMFVLIHVCRYVNVIRESRGFTSSAFLNNVPDL